MSHPRTGDTATAGASGASGSGRGASASASASASGSSSSKSTGINWADASEQEQSQSSTTTETVPYGQLRSSSQFDRSRSGRNEAYERSTGTGTGTGTDRPARHSHHSHHSHYSHYSTNQQNEEQATREHGIVTVLKDSYGFIQCVDRSGTMYFNFRSCETIPQLRAEVSFLVTTDRNSTRMLASKVEILPTGTLAAASAAEQIERENVIGTIVGELKGQFDPTNSRTRQTAAQSLAAGRPEAYGGKIQIKTTDADAQNTDVKVNTYEFSERDLVDANTLLMLGDEVAFDIFVEKKSGRRGATKVKLLQMNQNNRAAGIVVTVNPNYGFVQLVSDDEQSNTKQSQPQAFFHVSNFIRPTEGQNVQVNDELEFDVKRDDNGKVAALRIVKLAKGTLTSTTISETTYQGTVVESLLEPTSTTDTPVAAVSDGQTLNMTFPSRGTITYDTNGTTERVTFNRNDFRGQRGEFLLVGDTVSFNIATSGRSKKTRATNLKLLTPTTSRREQGIVTMVKTDGGFAFVDCITRSERVFAHFSNFKSQLNEQGEKKPIVPTVGMEVEFNMVFETAGKMSAVRISQLEAGTVQFETSIPGIYTGTVTKMLKRTTGARDDTKQSWGQIEVTATPADEKDESNGSNGTNSTNVLISIGSAVSFGDENESHSKLLTGDVVTFTLKQHKRTQTLTASNISIQTADKSHRTRGRIFSLNPTKRLGKLLSITAANPISFSFDDFEGDEKAFEVGSSVEFNILTVHSSTSRSDSRKSKPKSLANAVRLTLLSAGSVPELETVDRQVKWRGWISSAPSRGASATGLIRIIDGVSTESTVLPTAHPAVLLDGAVLKVNQYYSHQTHPAALPLQVVPKNEHRLSGDVHFRLSDLSDSNVCLSRGDFVFCSLVHRVPPIVHVRAIEIELIPIQATVTQTDAGTGSSYGLVKVQAREHSTEEHLTYVNADVLDGVTLAEGDVVQVAHVEYDNKNRRRQAKRISRLMEASIKQRNVVKRAGTATVNIISRFAKGPAQDGSKGFTSRRTQMAKTDATTRSAPAETDSEQKLA